LIPSARSLGAILDIPMLAQSIKRLFDRQALRHAGRSDWTYFFLAASLVASSLIFFLPSPGS
jgi:hypothetical protein